MLPRFRSFYGKLVVFAIVALCFILYIKILNIDEKSSLSSRHHPFISDRLQQLQLPGANKFPVSENEIFELPQVPPLQPAVAASVASDSPYEMAIRLDLQKQEPGLGDDGEAVHLHGEAKIRGDAIYKKIALNEELSERLSYNRTAPDARNPLCHKQQFNVATLPTASVIIIFFDEPFSVLLRTVHSTLNTCNAHALKEIILVDDGSTHMDLGGKLDYYIRSRIPNGKVQVLRLKTRETLSETLLAQENKTKKELCEKIPSGNFSPELSLFMHDTQTVKSPLQSRVRIKSYSGSKSYFILVDDGSTHMDLGGKLDYYIRSRIPNGKVQVLRLKTRLGLIRARLAGARIATGDVLIFLDAHCEAVIGWCEPLLDRIRESRTSVLVPIIDVIDAKDFQYSTNGYKSFQVGGFQWSGHFDWINIPLREKKRQLRECKHEREICPAHSPTMAGGLFAIDRRYFWEVGSYDEQMDGWGGENLEMSFRIWQCGGTIETIPCSRVGHVFRDFHPYKFPNNRDTHGINTARMALVWMDDYINVFFLNRPDLKFHPDIGDVTHRVMLRKKLRCKNFDWYLKNIYPEKFVPTQNVINYGRIKAANSNLCLDDLLQNNEKPYNMGVFSCGKTLSKSQFFSFTNSQVLRNELSCATVQHSDSPPHLVVMVPCMEKDDYNERWIYENERFTHVNTGLCLDYRGVKSMDEVQMATCDVKSETQRWVIEHE